MRILIHLTKTNWLKKTTGNGSETNLTGTIVEKEDFAKLVNAESEPQR